MTFGTKTKRIIFFGNERLVSGLDHTETPIISMLIESEYEVCAVVVNNADTRSRKQKVLEVAELAKAHDIPVYAPSNPMDVYDTLKALNADAGILVAYGRIVPQALIDLFPFGIINIHPSLLPRYRGPSPIETAIRNGDDTTGISIMALTSRMDAGPIYHQVEYNLPSYESAPHLSQKLAGLAATELSAALPKIFDGTLAAVEQDESRATYCELITKEQAVLDPSSQTAIEAERIVRAYKAYPRARITLGDHQLIVLEAHCVDSVNSPLDIAFTEGVLSIDLVVAPSGKTLTADEFQKGYIK